MAEVRRAEKRDLENIIALLETFPDLPELPGLNWEDARRAFPELLEGKRGLILVSEERDALAGLVSLSFAYALHFGGEYALIEDFIVDKTFRGQGIGSPLLQAAFDEARLRGCREIQVNGATDEGLPVYVRNGMHEAGKHLKAWL
jgi:GNAT superfamily N-acetyltransferase